MPCAACGAETVNTLCVGCNFKKANVLRQQKRLALANEWPASQRGDRTSHEGWEELRNWEEACRINGLTQIADKHETTKQLVWLNKIRKSQE